MSPALRASLGSVAGLVAGPAALVVTTEAGQILPYGECAGAPPLSLVAALCGVALSLAGAWISFSPIRGRHSGTARSPAAERSPYPRTFGFVSLLGTLTGLLVALALAFQATAALIVPPCLR